MKIDRIDSTGLACEAANGDVPVNLRVSVVDIGQLAQAELEDSQNWRVVARFRRSIYLQAGHRNIICLCSSSLNPGPLNVRCAMPETVDWRSLHLGEDRVIAHDGDALCFGDRIRIDFGEARTWKPDPIPSLRGTTSSQLKAVLGAVANRAPEVGLGSVLLRPRSEFAPGHQSVFHALLKAAAPAIQALTYWLEETRIQRGQPTIWPPLEATNLLGLGPGLTPSGDDYLGGLMIGLCALKRHDLADSLARLILPEARRRTGVISYAHLACAAEGHGSKALHEMIAAIAGAPLDLDCCLDSLERMGATSGWDALAGAVLPLRVYLEPRTPTSACGT